MRQIAITAPVEALNRRFGVSLLPIRTFNSPAGPIQVFGLEGKEILVVILVMPEALADSVLALLDANSALASFVDFFRDALLAKMGEIEAFKDFAPPSVSSFIATQTDPEALPLRIREILAQSGTGLVPLDEGRALQKAV